MYVYIHIFFYLLNFSVMLLIFINVLYYVSIWNNWNISISNLKMDSTCCPVYSGPVIQRMGFAKIFRLLLTFPKLCQAYKASIQNVFFADGVSVSSLPSRIAHIFHIPREFCQQLVVDLPTLSRGGGYALCFQPDWPTRWHQLSCGDGCKSLSEPNALTHLKCLTNCVSPISCSAVNLLIPHVHCLRGGNNLVKLSGLPESYISHCKLLNHHPGSKRLWVLWVWVSIQHLRAW